jgi:poly(3-hydroxybutyrate) depolymerase
MKGPLSDLGAFITKADAKAAAGQIDPLELVRRQKVYIFHGYNDTVIARAATDAAAAFYRHYLGDANRGNLYYQTAVGAGHSLVVGLDSPNGGLNSCDKSEPPYIDTCSYDQAGVILQHIYGLLNKPVAGPLTGTMKRFDQSAYTGSASTSLLSLGQIGYVFVPRACESGEACRVHIALHGCLQDEGHVDRAFVDRTGYNAWADANRLIVLYPQTAASDWFPANPKACWDWWGYLDYTDDYVTKAGRQIKAIKAMLDTLTSRAVPGTAVPPAAPLAVSVKDTSDTSADLVWAPQAGATGYRVLRAAGGGQFAAIADVSAAGFADSGLAPKTAYRWRVAPLVNGIEGSPSGDAEAVTRAAVACTNPGSCPWSK